VTRTAGPDASRLRAIMGARALVLALFAAALLPGCSNVPGFCGVTNDARTAVSNVSPDQYPAVAGQDVAEVRDAAKGLGGQKGVLAHKVADDLEAASRAAWNSLQFSNAYNRFVSDSNDFDHRYCNESPPP
jgi:hypothetical protein